MKKLLFFAFVAILSIFKINAQESTFGITAGFNSLAVKTSFDEGNISNSESGFFVGFFAEFVAGESISLQPQINYATVFADGERLNELIIPIMLKYYPSDKLFLQIGPQFDYILEEDAEGLNKLGVGLGFGLGFDFSKNVFLSARYAFGINNRIDIEGDNLFDLNEGITSTFNNFQIGIGYRF